MLGNMGTVYVGLGDLSHAIQCFEQYQAIASAMDDRRAAATASWRLGRVFEQQGDLPRAAAAMSKLVDYTREMGHPDAAALAQYVADVRSRIASMQPPQSGAG